VSTAYHFSVLRFCFDPLTEEFVNVGIVLYAKEQNFLRARVTPNYGRASRFFLRIDGTRFRQFARFVADGIMDIGEQLETGLRFEKPSSLESILARVLPPDDSSFSFGRVGGGVSSDLTATLDVLFGRYVDVYARPQEEGRRDEEDVWRTFREEFDRRSISGVLIPKKICSKDYEYDFQHAWKNGVWNLYEPVSFDLLDASSMLEKANKWVGRAFALETSQEPFKLNILLGAPQDSKLKDAYVRAENLLNRMPIKHEFVRENEAHRFARELEVAIKTPHGQ
jgi:hypothetical protein